MNYKIPHKNLFHADDATTDGVAVGASGSVVGLGKPVMVTLVNTGGAVVDIEYREIQEHRGASIGWAKIGMSAVGSEHMQELLRSGFEYRFNIVTAGTQRVAVHITPVSNDAYDEYLWWLYDHDHGEVNHEDAGRVPNSTHNYQEQFGFRGTMITAGYIPALPAAWVGPLPATTLVSGRAVFEWDWNDQAGIGWTIDIGTAAGLSDIQQLSGALGTVDDEGGISTQNLPTDGSAIFVTVTLACFDGSVVIFTQNYTAVTY